MRLKFLSMFGFIALLSPSPFQVIGRMGESDNRYRHNLTEARTSNSIVKSQRSTRPSAEIPFELSGNLVFLRGRVNGSARSLWFMLDSGVSRSVLDVKMAQVLGLKPEGVDSGITPVGSVNFSYVDNVSFNLNGFVLPRREIVAAALGSFESILGRRVDGILGYDFFQHHVIELNYQKRLITIYEPKDFTYPGRANSVNAVLVNNIPFVRAGVRQTRSQFIEGYFEIDTGAADLTLYQSFVDGQKLLESSQPTLLVPLAGINGSRLR
jgi:hypothetical protein